MSSRPAKARSTSSRTVLLIVALIAVLAAAIAAAVHFTAQTPGPVATPPGPALLEPGGKTRGRADAPVTIEVYSDFL